MSRCVRFILCVPVILLIALATAAKAADLSKEDLATAETLKRQALVALEADVDKYEKQVRQARAQKSRNLRSALDGLEDAKKRLADAKRKPPEEYFQEKKPAEPPKEQAKPEAGPAEVVPAKGLFVVFPYTVVYVPHGGDSYDFKFMIFAFDGKSPTQGFVEIESKPVKIKAESSDSAIIEITPDPKFISSPFVCRFRSPGKATVTASAGQYRVEQQIEVVEIPVAEGSSSSDVIEQMGFPTDKKQVYVAWPDDKFIDCFMYSPEAGKPFIGEHWTYQKYPSLFLSISQGKVWRIGTRQYGSPTRATHSVQEPNFEADRTPAIP